jgi:TonB family protein
MKTHLFVAALAGLSLLHPAFAESTDALARPPATLIQPRAITVVEPTMLPRSFAGGIVTVEFTLDSHGRPQDIRLPSVKDRELAAQVLKAFSQWQFALPSDAALAAKRFVIPLEIRAQG